MTRVQVLKSGGIVRGVSAGVPVPLSNVTHYVKSLIIQALPANTDFVAVGDATLQVHQLEPRRSLKVWGDNLDNGTTGKIDLAKVFINAAVANEGVSFTYLEGL